MGFQRLYIILSIYSIYIMKLMQGEKNESVKKKKACTSNELGLAKTSALQVKKSFNRMIR